MLILTETKLLENYNQIDPWHVPVVCQYAACYIACQVKEWGYLAKAAMMDLGRLGGGGGGGGGGVGGGGVIRLFISLHIS